MFNSGRVRVLAALVIFSSVGSNLNSAFADGVTPTQSQSSDAPAAFADAAILDKHGAEVSPDITLVDENGQKVQLGSYFKSGKPVILTLGYYGCATLCSFVLNGAVDGLKKLDWKPGEKYQIISVSIDPREGPELAKQKKANYLQALGAPQAEGAWHFLTGEEAQVKKLASQVGFGYRYDKADNQYVHGAGIFVLTPERKLSRTLYGIEYREKDLKLALLEASNGKIGTVIDRIMLFCYQYNSHTKKYSLTATRLMQAGGASTVLLVGGYLAVFWNRQARRKDEDEPEGKNV